MYEPPPITDVRGHLLNWKRLYVIHEVFETPFAPLAWYAVVMTGTSAALLICVVLMVLANA